MSEVTQSCPNLCNPMDCSLPGSSIHGIFQARILEWVAFPFSRRSSQPRDWTWVSRIVGRCFTVWATREVPKKCNAKECSNNCTIALISHVSKVMLKVLQARLEQYMKCELPDVQAGLEKAEEPEINCQHLLDQQKSKRILENHLFHHRLCHSLCLCGSQ